MAGSSPFSSLLGGIDFSNENNFKGIGSDTFSTAGASGSMVFPLAAVIGAAGQIGGGLLQGMGTAAAGRAAQKASQYAADQKQMGQYLGLSAQNVADAFTRSDNMYGAKFSSLLEPMIALGTDIKAKEYDLSTFKPQEFALGRKEQRLADEYATTAIPRGLRDDAFRKNMELQTAGKYAEAFAPYRKVNPYSS
jgi:hypothetical protein